MANPLAIMSAPGGGSFSINLGMICLFAVFGVNLQVSQDNIFQRLFGGVYYQPVYLYARLRSGAPGGTPSAVVTDQAALFGNQAFTISLTTIALNSIGIMSLALGGLGGSSSQQPQYTNTPFLHVSGVSSTAATCDFYMYGFDVT